MDEDTNVVVAPEASGPADGPGVEYLATLERLRAALAATIPGITAEAIGGTLLAEVEANYAALSAAFDAGIERARGEAAQQIPAGYSGRVTAMTESPREKIRRGLAALDEAG